MAKKLEEALISIWQQSLAENSRAVELEGRSFPVRLTSRRGLRQVDFSFEGQSLRGIEQNPETKSRWAQMARAGEKVMQFLAEGRYIANVADGKVNFYGHSAAASDRKRETRSGDAIRKGKGS